ncbi:hypothetical protein PDE_03462 [Penicillium oxalicum 114-2]|uniref:Chitin synthase activator n=1 Tax=Penicillium oxalicum (strain 114-2 / CGMCC 5302) TaxID=933388 RepID=S7ZIJ4_PENO1|nr:hypothetical protein PDE_03462 [Penicillium oxalicum 114-2]
MAYPQRPAQRPPPMRQYDANSPVSPVSSRGYAPEFAYGGEYGERSGTPGGYELRPGGDRSAGGQDDPSYSYQAGPAGAPPHGSSQQPRSMRPPPGPVSPDARRPPMGYNDRRGYPGDRPPGPPGTSRSRPPGGRPPPPGGNFDSPFPAVPGGRDPRDRRGPPPRGGGGIENGMAAMDLNGRGIPPRPHTSNSNGRRPDMRQPPPRGPPPPTARGGYPPGPARAASSGRSDRTNRPYPDPMGPSMGPSPPSRSATMPSHMVAPNYPGQPSYREPDFSAAPMSEMPPPRPNTAGGMRAPRHPDYDMEFGLGAGAGGSLMPPIPPDPGSRVSYAPREFLDTYYEPTDDEPDMPNFDAIPNSRAGPTDEMGLETPKPAQTGPSPSSGTNYSGSRQNSIPNQFENAGFQFDIPSDGSSRPNHDRNMGPGQNGYGPGYPQTGPVHGPPQGYPAQQSPIYDENPDALPHHPVPFRPGHDQSAKPAPVRQYGSAPVANPMPGPVAPQTAAAKIDENGPITHDELQKLQMKARGNPEDQGLQLLLAKKFVEASTVLVAENTHFDPKMKAKAQEKYILDAHKIVKKLASAGFAEAQFYLADCYGEGRLGLQVDAKEAFSLYLSAAKAGHAQSAYRVAVCCEIGAEEGGGTRRDPFKAVQWYKRAAALGDTPAMYKIGMINLKGLLGQKGNPREGVSWLKRAAERADEENPHALHELALMYQSASGNDIIVRDEAYASQLFHQAADLGYKFSQFRLGAVYEYGLLGCPVDNRMSIIWYTRAAAQGEHQSELALSGWYLTGSEGILQQNDTEAYLWARKAASAGLAKAEYAMGYYTEVGIGVTANLEDAKRWYWRAAAQGFPKARERLEDLRRGGGRYQKTRLSRSAVSKQSEGDCVLM